MHEHDMADLGRPGTLFRPPATGQKASDWNREGQTFVDNLLADPNRMVIVGHPVIDIRLPSGQGARWTMGGDFMGFLD